MDEFATHQLTTSARCPTCSMLMDGATNVQPGERGSPSPGDVTVCAYCATMLQFTDGLALRELSSAEIDGFPVDVRGSLLRAQRAILLHPFPRRPEAP